MSGKIVTLNITYLLTVSLNRLEKVRDKKSIFVRSIYCKEVENLNPKKLR